MEIKYLCDNISFADTTAAWIFNEFIKGIKIDRTYDQTLAAIKNCHKDKLPIRLIAMENNICTGTIALVENDLKCRNYTPWLASLYVDVPFRSRKIAQQLIERIKIITGELGYTELFLRTEHASNYYKRLGWQYVETCEDLYNLKPDVFKCKI